MAFARAVAVFVGAVTTGGVWPTYADPTTGGAVHGSRIERGAVDTELTRCSRFRVQVMAGRRAAMAALVSLAHDGSGVLFQAEQIRRARVAAGEVAGYCALPRFRDVGRVGCRPMKLRAATDPTLWCEAAARASSLVVRGVQNYIRRDLAVRARLLGEPKELRLRSGWIRRREPTTWRREMHFTSADVTQLLARYRPLFIAAGMRPQIPKQLLAAHVARYAARRAIATALAGRLVAPSARADSYATAMAARIARGQHPGGQVLRTGMNEVGWVTRYDAAGQPVSRRHYGQVLVRVANEPWCQLRSFYLQERYRYRQWQRPGEIRFHAMRFQRCR